MMPDFRTRTSAFAKPLHPSWTGRIVGAAGALIGLVLAIGGAWLGLLGGSLYYLLTGVAMLIAGVLLFRGRVLGGWIYLAVVLLTFLWAWWEVGANAWAQVPRVIAPVVLLVPVLAAMATLGGGRARRYSPLAQINAANVGGLKRAWLVHTGDMPSSARIAKTYGAENTPLKIGDSLYLCTPKNILIALSAANGEQRWRYDPNVPDKAIPYTAACRGVVYYAVPGMAADQPCATRVIEGTLDARLIAVDARNGRPCADFGANGQAEEL